MTPTAGTPLSEDVAEASPPPPATLSDDRQRRKQSLDAEIRAARRAVLVVNTHSRQGRRLYAVAKRLLIERGIELVASYPVRNPVRLPEIVQEAIAQGHRLVIVGGGDGTVSSVVDYFAHRDVVLAVLPVGTANSYARTIGIPLDIEGAVDVAVDGKVADVDLGRVDDDYFANAVAIGLPAAIARSTPRAVKRWFGRAGYLLVAAVELFRHEAFRCTIRAHDRTIELDAQEVRIAKGNYQGGVLVTGEAGVESRDLVIQAIRGRTRWAVLRFWLDVARGRSPGPDDVVVVRGASFMITTTPAQYVSIDGEPVMQTPVRASVAREALLLRVPRDRDDIS